MAALLLFTPGCQDTRSATEQAAQWWPASEQDAARCVIHYESTGRPDEVYAGNYGILQINRSVWAERFESFTGKPFIPGVYDPRLSGQFARFVIWPERHWRSWAVHSRCGV